jgi:hypothetical protein
MSIVTIPVDNTSGKSVQRIALEGAVYTLTIRWNSRMACWLLDVAAADGTTIISGLAIREGWPVTAPYVGRYAGLPPGILQALDPTGAHQEPTFDTLGDTVPLYYAESS